MTLICGSGTFTECISYDIAYADAVFAGCSSCSVLSTWFQRLKAASKNSESRIQL